jgi:serine/threonine-protein kinase
MPRSDPAHLAVNELERTRELRPEEAGQFIPLLSPAEDLPSGGVAGQYVIDRVLGAGGGGIVYSAEHRLLKRRAAVKVLRREMAAYPSMIQRFEREAKAVNLIRHPNIVDIFEFGQLEDGRPYYIMELLEGTDLRRLLQLSGRLSPEEALALLEPVCLALDAAHKAGVVHRDLKASNIYVIDKGEQRTVKLLDFGIAKLMRPEPNGQGLTEAGAMLGTSHNMSPEQVRGEPVDGRADVYALGVLLYHLLTGQYPFHSEHTQEIAWMHLTAPPPRPSQSAPVPAAIDAIVLKAMEKQRDDRFPTARAFLEALRNVCGRRSASAPVEVQAVGIYVELRTIDDTGDDVDDAMLEDMALVLDSAEQILKDEHFVFPVHTCNALLGVQALGPDLDEERALELARKLRADLASRPEAHPRLHINVALRFDTAESRGDPDTIQEITAGGVLAIEQWAPQTNVTELDISHGRP